MCEYFYSATLVNKKDDFKIIAVAHGVVNHDVVSLIPYSFLNETIINTVIASNKDVIKDINDVCVHIENITKLV